MHITSTNVMNVLYVNINIRVHCTIGSSNVLCVDHELCIELLSDSSTKLPEAAPIAQW